MIGTSPGPPRNNFRCSVGRGGGTATRIHKQNITGLFERIVSIENLLLAWEKFQTGKRSREDVMVFERKLEDNLFDVRERLVSGRYRHSPYEPFTIQDPKQRTIHKALVYDRVVHQAIVNVIEPFFERQFIHDSYFCRVDKGTHAAVARLQGFLRRATDNNTKTMYALKCDVRKFFASVNHEILMRLLERRIDDPKVIAVLRLIVDSFCVTPGTGIPLGNLTSQLFANVYLHELDWFVKQKLGVKHYVRYCDDFVMLAPSRSACFALVEKTNAFLRQNLKTKLHPDKVHVLTWTQGIDFLGYVLLPHAVILRPTTAGRMIKRVTVRNASSYLGLCDHADAYDLERMVRNKIG